MPKLEDWKFTQVDSSNIDAVGYDSDAQTLQVIFRNGGIYQYDNVTQAEYYGLLEAGSKGRYLADNIKGRKPYSRIV